MRNGSYNVNSLDHLHNSHIYDGNDNYIIHSKIFSQKFICSFDFHQYPFDVQLCTMDFILRVGHLL